MDFDETDIADAKKNGARVRGAGGAPLREIEPPKPKADSEAPMRQLLVALRSMATSIESAIAKRGEPPTVTVRPEITVNPKLEMEAPAPAPRSWTLEVTERDKDRMIKKLTFTAQ